MDPDEQTLLTAIQAGDAKAVHAILDDDPGSGRARDDDGVSMVMHAIYQRQSDVLALVAPVAAPLDIFEASGLGDVDRLHELLDHDPALLDATSPDGFTPLGLAASFGHPEAVTLLLERGADASAVQAGGRTPADLAVEAGHEALAVRLLD